MLSAALMCGLLESGADVFGKWRTQLQYFGLDAGALGIFGHFERIEGATVQRSGGLSSATALPLAVLIHMSTHSFLF